MKNIIVLVASILAISPAYGADEKKVVVAKLETKAQVAAHISKPASKPAVAPETPVCDYSVETDCR